MIVTQITAAILIRHKVCEKQVVSPSGLMNRASYLSHPILHGDNLGVLIEEKLPQLYLLCITPLLRNSACYSASCVFFFFYMNNFLFSIFEFLCMHICIFHLWITLLHLRLCKGSHDTEMRLNQETVWLMEHKETQLKLVVCSEE